MLAINEEFTSKLRRLNVNKIVKSHRKVKEENKEADEKVMEDRRFEIEAAVVRILKEKKVMQHNELVKTLIERLKFPVEIP